MLETMTALLVLFSMLPSPVPPADRGQTEQKEDRLTAARKLLDQAIAQAETRLERKACAAFFGPEAVPALHATDYRIVSFGTPQFREGKLVVPGAETTSDHKRVLINLDGPFVSSKILVGGKFQNFKGVQPRRSSIALSDADIRVVIILHELGHVLGKFGPDARRTDDSQWHSDEIVQYCL